MPVITSLILLMIEIKSSAKIKFREIKPKLEGNFVFKSGSTAVYTEKTSTIWERNQRFSHFSENEKGTVPKVAWNQDA